MCGGYLITVYALIGWIVVTAGVVGLWVLTFQIIRELGSNLLKIYRAASVKYWMDRMEKEGTHCFKKVENDD